MGVVGANDVEIKILRQPQHAFRDRRLKVEPMALDLEVVIFATEDLAMELGGALRARVIILPQRPGDLTGRAT